VQRQNATDTTNTTNQTTRDTYTILTSLLAKESLIHRISQCPLCTVTSHSRHYHCTYSYAWNFSRLSLVRHTAAWKLI